MGSSSDRKVTLTLSVDEAAVLRRVLGPLNAAAFGGMSGAVYGALDEALTTKAKNKFDPPHGSLALPRDLPWRR